MKTEPKRLGITYSGEQLDKIDDYRKDISGIPDRTNAIRQLIDLGYEYHKLKKDSAKQED